MTSSIRQRFPLSGAGVAVPGGDAAECTAQLPAGMRVIPVRREDAAPLAELSVHDRGGVVVVSLRGELDFSGASSLQAYLRGIRWQARARSVADLTGLAFIDCACLGVLVSHCKEVQGRGGGFALAGPRPGVRRILSVTGLLSWFEVHDTVEEASTDAGAQRSAIIQATPAVPRPCGVPLVPTARSRAISEVPMSQGSDVVAASGPGRGGAAVPAPGWLS
ncbi:MAG TPA: anti-sigma factor antagonist [Streptosporangiaceae bacterium]|jgi:anti-sigma B factor antagonist|nr:anti-sigma factor antagonist [Streptosporangiaceae bacterium]